MMHRLNRRNVLLCLHVIAFLYVQVNGSNKDLDTYTKEFYDACAHGKLEKVKEFIKEDPGKFHQLLVLPDKSIHFFSTHVGIVIQP